MRNDLLFNNGDEVKFGEKEIAVREIKSNSVISKTNLPSGDYCVNSYTGCIHACKYCYASFMNRFSGHNEPWGSYLDVKTWPCILNPKKYDGKELIIGSVTDPYNPFEEKFERTKRLLLELRGTNAKITIITKSDLVVRDLNIIKNFPNICVAFSINTLDENFKNDMDSAVSIERRLKAMKTFYENKIRTACFISPIFPQITNVQAIMNTVVHQCNFIWLENLNLRGEYKAKILKYIAERYPELVPLYDEIYRKNNNRYWIELATELQNFCKDRGLIYVVDNGKLARPFNEPPVVVNFFYHSQIKQSAKRRKS